MKKYSIVILLAFIWAAYYYSLSISNKLLSPFVTGTFIRMFTCLLLTLVMLVNKTIKRLKVSRKVIPLLILIGCMGFLLDITAFFGSRLGSAVTGTLLLKIDVIMVGLISAVFYKESFSKKEWILVFVMLLGVVLVLEINPTKLTFEFSDTLFILSAFFVSCNAFLIKKAQQSGIQNQVIAYYNNFVTLLFFGGAVVFDSNKFFLDYIFQNHGLLVSLTVGVLGQFFVYILYYKSLHELPVKNVKLILLLMPVITLLYDFLFTGAIPSFTKLLGTLIVLVSAGCIIVTNTTTKKCKIERSTSSEHC